MRIFFVLILLAGSQLIMSQPIQLSILGRKTYTHYPDQYLFDIGYPNSEYEHNTLQNLLSGLDSVHVEYFIDSSQFQGYPPQRQKTYAIITNTVEQFDLLRQQAQRHGMAGISSYRYLNIQNGAEDELAFQAFHDAYRRAHIMADHLGRKISKVINIDDQVEQYLFYFDRTMRTRCELNRAKLYIKLLTLLSDDSYTDQSVSERTGQYALWVTFELK